jgi:signal transduction histidine kinase
MSKLFIFIFILFSFSCKTEVKNKIIPKAKEGMLDLRNWNFGKQITENEMSNALYLEDGQSIEDEENDGIVSLDGEWEFYWQEFPETRDKNLLLNENNKDYICVPKSWNNHITKNNVQIDGEGYATYRLKILLKKDTPVSFKIPSINTAYTIYLDNNLLLKSGIIGKDDKSSFPEKSRKYLIIIPANDELVITVLISNYHYVKGGITESFFIGNPIDINEYQKKHLSISLFVTGILFIMGFYHLCLFYLRKTDKSALYFGLFCLLLLTRNSLTGESYTKKLFSDFSYSFLITAEFLSFYLAAPVFNKYINTLYPKETVPILRKFFNIITLFFSIITLVSPPLLFTKTLFYYQMILLTFILYIVYISIKTIIRKRESAKTMLLGFLFFGITIVNDILYSNNFVNTGFYAPYGFVAFIFSQSFLLTRRFANAFDEVKNLSKNLEKKVKERTNDLERQKQEIQKAYEKLKETQRQLIESEKLASLGQLVGGIAHEINNPIAVISSQIKILEINNHLTITEVPLFLDSLSSFEKKYFFTIFNVCMKEKKFKSSKEERKERKDLEKKLNEILFDKTLSNKIAEQLVNLQMTSNFETHIKNLGENKFQEFLYIIAIFKNQSNSFINIELSIEKISRIIFALKNYLNTQIQTEKKETNLVQEMNKVLNVYNNYIRNKIVIEKHLPEELNYFCFGENISQIFKNLIFNSIQATYKVENKKIIIKMMEIEEIPESINNKISFFFYI